MSTCTYIYIIIYIYTIYNIQLSNARTMVAKSIPVDSCEILHQKDGWNMLNA